MSLTPEEFLERAAADKAMREQMKATNTEVTPDTFRGCAMALVQLAHALKMKREDVGALVIKEWTQWEMYLGTKQRLADKRKGVK